MLKWTLFVGYIFVISCEGRVHGGQLRTSTSRSICNVVMTIRSHSKQIKSTAIDYII